MKKKASFLFLPVRIVAIWESYELKVSFYSAKMDVTTILLALRLLSFRLASMMMGIQ